MRFMRDDDNNSEDEDFFSSEHENFISQQNALEGFHLHIVEKKLRADILFESIENCKKSFFWNFMSNQSKMQKIKNFYNFAIELLEMKE